MHDINQTILQKASGETRLNPDEQRRFMGSYKERVITTLLLQDAIDDAILSNFNKLLIRLTESYHPLFVKLSPQLGKTRQIPLMRAAKELDIDCSIINESDYVSPYAIVVHTDHAVMIPDINALTTYSDIFYSAKSPEKSKKWRFFDHFRT